MFKGIIRVIVSYTMMLFSLLLTISLLSFSFNDIAWYTSQFSGTNHNWLSDLGVNIASPFITTYGYGALTWPIAFCYIGCRLLLGIDPVDLFKSYTLFHALAFFSSIFSCAVTNNSSFTTGGFFGSFITQNLFSIAPSIVWSIISFALMILTSLPFFPQFKSFRFPFPKKPQLVPVTESGTFNEEFDEEFDEEPKQDPNLFAKDYVHGPIETPVIEESSPQESSTQESSIQESSVQESLVQESSTQESSVQESLIQESSAQESSAQESSIQESNSEEFQGAATNNQEEDEMNARRMIETRTIHLPTEKPSSSFSPIPEFLQKDPILDENPLYLTKKRLTEESSEPKFLREVDVDLLASYRNVDNEFYQKLEQNQINNPDEAGSEFYHSLENKKPVRLSFTKGIVSDQNTDLVIEDEKQHTSYFPPETHVNNSVHLVDYTKPISSDFTPVIIEDSELSESEVILLEGMERTLDRNKDKQSLLKERLSLKQQELAESYYQDSTVPHSIDYSIDDLKNLFSNIPDQEKNSDSFQLQNVVENFENTLKDSGFEEVKLSFAQDFLNNEISELKNNDSNQVAPNYDSMSDPFFVGLNNVLQSEDDNEIIQTVFQQEPQKEPEQEIYVQEKDLIPADNNEFLKEFMIFPEDNTSSIEKYMPEPKKEAVIDSIEEIISEGEKVTEIKEKFEDPNIQNNMDIESYINEEIFADIPLEQNIPQEDLPPLPSLNIYASDDLLERMHVTDNHYDMPEVHGDSIVFINGTPYIKYSENDEQEIVKETEPEEEIIDEIEEIEPEEEIIDEIEEIELEEEIFDEVEETEPEEEIIDESEETESEEEIIDEIEETEPEEEMFDEIEETESEEEIFDEVEETEPEEEILDEIEETEPEEEMFDEVEETEPEEEIIDESEESLKTLNITQENDPYYERFIQNLEQLQYEQKTEPEESPHYEQLPQISVNDIEVKPEEESYVDTHIHDVPNHVKEIIPNDPEDDPEDDLKIDLERFENLIDSEDVSEDKIVSMDVDNISVIETTNQLYDSQLTDLQEIEKIVDISDGDEDTNPIDTNDYDYTTLDDGYFETEEGVEDIVIEPDPVDNIESFMDLEIPNPSQKNYNHDSRQELEEIFQEPLNKESLLKDPYANDSNETFEFEEPISNFQDLDKPEFDLMPRSMTLSHLVDEEKSDKKKEYQFPTPEILDPNLDHISKEEEDLEIEESMKMIEDTYESFNINMQVVDYSRGPTITRFELEPPSGLKLRTIFNLQDDLALQAGTSNIRIISPVEGRSYIGIEVPNKIRRQFLLREQIESVPFQESTAELPLILGVDVGGKEIVSDLATTPHLLIAGTTGSGKSVFVNALILGLLYKLSPEDLRFIMIDPKMVELELYSGIPHLLAPIITRPEEAMAALDWAVQEMDRRYKILSELGLRNIKEYKDLSTKPEGQGLEKLPYIVIIVDEFANLMVRAPKDTEKHISRLASMSRAVGMHLVLATQRPSVDVVTGVIKANFPSRIALRVSSKTDSRTILDKNGAETLLGRGDMLLMSPNYMDTVRIQSPYASGEDVMRVVTQIKKNGSPEYVVNFSDLLNQEEEKSSDGVRTDSLTDPIFEEVLRYAVDNGEISASGIQRRFRVGYNRASRLIESLKDLKIISPPSSAGKGWLINITRDQIENFLNI